jgi:hypothetical protein
MAPVVAGRDPSGDSISCIELADVVDYIRHTSRNQFDTHAYSIRRHLRSLRCGPIVWRNHIKSMTDKCFAMLVSVAMRRLARSLPFSSLDGEI